MKNIVLDTNILIHIVRGKNIAQQVSTYVKTIPDHQLFISVVSIAEAESLVVQRKWAKPKVESLKEQLQKFICIDIENNNSIIMDAYVSIDAFSQGKKTAPDGKNLNNSSRNMGKNDLWIAATAHALDAILLTTDGDFDHLHNIYFQVKKF